MRRPQSNRLQSTYLSPDGEEYYPVPPEGLDADVHNTNCERYQSPLENRCSPWPHGSVKSLCPHQILMTKEHHEQGAKLHEALALAIDDIVERWWTDEKAHLPQRMPLEPQEEDLLRWMHQNPSLIPPYRKCHGSWRPDFLLENGADSTEMERFRICEINARFCWNGYVQTAIAQEGVSVFNLDKKGLKHGAEPEDILGGLLGLFNHHLPLHLLKDEERGMDIHMFVTFMEERLGVRPRLITPHELRLIPDSESKTGYKLCCFASPQTPADRTFTLDSGETVEEVHQVGLELHQRELRVLSPEMMKELTVRGFNDMRTVLLVHDKRMLGIVLQELSGLVSRRVITPDQAGILESGITPTMLPGSAELGAFIDRSNASPQLKDGYILKPVRSGKGAGILFGDQLSHAEWQAKLEQLKCPQLEPGKTVYVVQRKINQLYYDITIGTTGKPTPCHMVGTYHAVNGQFLGLGGWRCSAGRLCAVADGATWTCSVMRSA